MSNWAQRAIKWLLAGAGFVAVLTASGCMDILTGDSDVTRAAPPSDTQAPITTRAEDLAAPTNAEASAPSSGRGVNVFGELAGANTSAVPAVSAAGGTANIQQHTSDADGIDGDVAIDPTGRWMVFASTRNSEHAEIFLQKVNGVSVIQLTSDGADAAYPTFSPDGKKIAFSSTRGGTWNIYTMDVDGRNVVQVTNRQAQDMHASFSPDGTRLVYSSLGSRSGQWELWTANLNSGEKRIIGYGLFPTWSPEKGHERIAFQRPRQRGSRMFSLWTLDLVDGEACRLTEVAASSNAAVISPAWSPDGRRLVFATVVDPAAAPGTPPQHDVWMVDADGTNRQRLTDGIGTNLTPFWSVDNRVYFISDRGGSQAIWSVRASVPAVITAAAPTTNESKTVVGVDASETEK